MSNIPENLLYSDDHEWVLVNKNTVKVGITDHAQDSLGDGVCRASAGWGQHMQG